MKNRSPLPYGVLLVSLVVVCLGGCRDSGKSATSFWRRNPDDVASRNKSPEQQMTEGNIEFKLSLARSLEKQGRSERAVALYLDAVDDGYDGADVYHRLAVLHDKEGKHTASAEFYDEALQRDPDDPEILCDHGYSLYLQQEWPEAEASLRQAIALQPKLARAHNNLGLLLGRTGRHNDSLREFVRGGCGEAEARANLGFALVLEQHWADAHEQFELALSADSQCRRAQQGLNALQSMDTEQVVDAQPSGSGWASVGDTGNDVDADYRASLPTDLTLN